MEMHKPTDLGKFKALKTTSLKDLADGTVSELPTSDLTIQSETHITQFEYVEPDIEAKKYIIKKGCFSMVNTNVGMTLQPFELRKYNLLKTIDNTSKIFEEKNKFFKRLDIYCQLKKEPKRAILLCSPPGVGKTAAIDEVCQSMLQEIGTTVIYWDTSAIGASDVSGFFLNQASFSDEVKKLILVIEDIEGGTREESYGERGANSSLLNFLDGIGNPFKGVPTFIIATTNNPERSVGALIDRPGRFDKVIELKTPNTEECVLLLKFILEQESLSDEDREAMVLAAKNEFSIAHIQEVVVRSKLDDSSIKDVVKQLIDHKKRYADGFSKMAKQKLGL
jgi:hypothetical protein